jgi:phenylalanyl-tRNA synthetase beta chain
MKISWNWLTTFVDLSGLSPEDLSERLTNAGLEVDGIERTGAAFSGVVVGQITAVNPHPDADKLRLVTVSTGDASQQVVCGAPNVRPEAMIAFARVGDTVVNRKDGSLFTLTPAKIRGVVSEGMICAIDELGLGDTYQQDEDGIWILNDILTSEHIGQPLTKALGLEGDVVLDTAPTANRGDWMSVLGVARDIAALIDRPVKLPELDKQVADVVAKAGQTSSAFSVILTDNALCPVYYGAKLSNLSIAPSPAWMQNALAAAGVRSINNVVDITNIIMLLWGQPLHAFDACALASEGQTIGVSHAKAEESLVTLDGETRKLSDTNVVITADDAPVAMAGLMGGEATEIRDDSTELFLEAAVFNSAAIRHSAKALGMRTEASARFERGVDLAQCRDALTHAIQLLQEYANAELECVVMDGQASAPEQVMDLRLARIPVILGKAIPQAEVTAILQRLGFSVAEKSDGLLSVTVPSYRQQDVPREIDLIEELARIAGYDDVTDALPPMTEPVAFSQRQQFLSVVHAVMRGQGLQEVMTNSLVGPNFLNAMGVHHWDVRNQVTVTNSHSPDHTLMRQALLPSLLQVAQTNTASNIAPLLAGSQPEAALWIYECGRVYQKRGNAGEKHSGVVEKRTLGGLMLGQLQTGLTKQPVADYYAAKGVLENLFNQLGLGEQVVWTAYSDDELLHPGQTATVSIGKKYVGSVGVVHPLTVERLKLRQTPVVFELDLEQLYKCWKQSVAKGSSDADEPSLYPLITRDMAFKAPLALSHADILAVIEQEAAAIRKDSADAPELAACNVFDEYTGEHVEAGHRSLAYRLVWQHKEKTLTDDLVQQATDRVKHALSHQCPITFR